MAQLNVNLAGVSTGFDPIGPGIYQAEVDQVEPRLSKASGKPTVNWRYRITEGEHTGRLLFHNTSLQEHAKFSFRATLEALGFDPDVLDNEEGVSFDTDDLVGLQCTLVVVEGEYQGKTTDNIKKVLPAGEISG